MLQLTNCIMINYIIFQQQQLWSNTLIFIHTSTSTYVSVNFPLFQYKILIIPKLSGGIPRLITPTQNGMHSEHHTLLYTIKAILHSNNHKTHKATEIIVNRYANNPQKIFCVYANILTYKFLYAWLSSFGMSSSYDKNNFKSWQITICFRKNFNTFKIVIFINYFKVNKFL